jgi:hypothetical protein
MDMLLTAVSAIKHGDPALGSGSNLISFNRARFPVWRDNEAVPQTYLDQVATSEPVLEQIAGYFEGLTFGEFMAVALVRWFIDLYTSEEGVGLFKGPGRYIKLSERVLQVAEAAATLREAWDGLLRQMLVPPTSENRHVEGLLLLLSAPVPVQSLALDALRRGYGSVADLARIWSQQLKLLIPEYAEKAGKLARGSEALVYLHWDANEVWPEGSEILDDNLPQISGNGLRHSIVREPSARHLWRYLELDPYEESQVPPRTKAMFFGGGNNRGSGSARLDDLAIAIRKLYPSMDLLSSACDGGTLGKSALNVYNCIVCREYAGRILNPAAKTGMVHKSVRSLLDVETGTRPATMDGDQMIYNQEVLSPGTQIFVRFAFESHTRPETIGALVTAADWWLDGFPAVAGRRAVGYGLCRGQWLDEGEEIRNRYKQAYLEHLDVHAVQMREGLLDGQLGCGVQVVPESVTR